MGWVSGDRLARVFEDRIDHVDVGLIGGRVTRAATDFGAVVIDSETELPGARRKDTAPEMAIAVLQPYNVCAQCRHGGNEVPGQPYRNGHSVCNVQAAAATLGQLLTVIDVGADSHMASGNAVLECNGFEPKEEGV